MIWFAVAFAFLINGMYFTAFLFVVWGCLARLLRMLTP
jgi:hypothetical protein